MDMIKLRITAIEENRRKFGVVFMGTKVAVAFSRDSGAKVGYDARLISGVIRSGGSMKNWVCVVEKDSVFELAVDREFYLKNKNRIKKWKIEEIQDFTLTKERSEALLKMDEDIE